MRADAHGRTKYLTPSHQRRVVDRKARGSELKNDGECVVLNTKPRRGTLYKKYCAEELGERQRTGEISASEVAKILGCTDAAVTGIYVAYLEDYRQFRDAGGGVDSPHLESFEAFSARYFPDLMVPDFHLEWVDMITTTLGEGGKLLLLAPQRHGKTEMLIRYCLWRISLDPNICILWIGANSDKAAEPIGFMRQHLEQNEMLINDVLGPGGSFQPASRSALSWTNSNLTVANRSKIRKSPTLRAAGLNGAILGVDADLIIVDDPIDRAKAGSADLREKYKERFFTDVLSRKEEHTGLAYIGSRQHVDDLPAQVMAKPGWEVSVYQSHDPSCLQAEHEDHLHTDCVLWPEKRSFKWLMEQKEQDADHFERNYQNNPSADTFDRPSKDDLEAALDASRKIGDKTKGLRVLASVDPGSGVKKHAIVVWAYDDKGAREVMDIIQPNAGTPGMVKGVKEMYEKYRVTNWVFEKNRYEDQIKNDKGLQDIRSSCGLTYHLHYTGQNKTDPDAGIMAMLAELRRRPSPIRLPGYGHEEKAHFRPLIHQFLNYEPGRSRNFRDDLAMAAWVGWYWIDKHVGNQTGGVKVSYPKGFSSGSMPWMGWNNPGWRNAS